MFFLWLLTDKIHWQHRPCWNWSSDCTTWARAGLDFSSCHLKGVSYIQLCLYDGWSWYWRAWLSFLRISQSGGTPETRNGLLEVQKAFREAGLNFAKQVLISGFCFRFLLKSMSLRTWEECCMIMVKLVYTVGN